MIFNAELKFKTHEFMAPTLEEQASMHGSGAVSATDSRGLERQASVDVAKKQTSNMDDMIVAKLKQLIVQGRTDLWWFYHHEDTARSGTVSPTVWRDGLVSVLQLKSVPVMSYRSRLVALEHDGTIDYNRFFSKHNRASQ